MLNRMALHKGDKVGVLSTARWIEEQELEELEELKESEELEKTEKYTNSLVSGRRMKTKDNWLIFEVVDGVF